MDSGLSSYRVAIGIFYMKIRPVTVKHRYTKSYSFLLLLNELLNIIYYCAYLYGYPFKYYFVNIYFVLFIINIVLLISGDVETNPGPGNTSTDQNYCLTIYHHNIRSIRNKINDIVHIVQDFDIVFFTETHLDGYIESENILLPGFEKPIRKDRNSREVVLLYISKIISDFLDVMT